MTERTVEVNGAELCVESFGDPTEPPVLLLMGVGASMLWWEAEFCRSLADRGRFVIRYDQRDTGRSVTCEPGRPDYTGADLARDALGILDAHDLRAAHLVGVSAGGALAQLIAVGFRDRVLSLVLIATANALSVDRDLPGPTDELTDFAASAAVDWDDRESVVDYLVAYQRVLAGGRRPFDEAAARALVRRDVERARNPASAENHGGIPEGDLPHGPPSDVTAPTLVVHGAADPMFPLAHGEALACDIPGARLLVLERGGHGIDRADWAALLDAITEHTSRAPADDAR